MHKFEVPAIDTLSFPADTDGFWELEISIGGRAVAVDINANEDEMTPSMFERVQPFLADTKRFESIARSAVRDDYAADADGSSSLYLSHHAEEFNAKDRLKYFGTEDAQGLGVDELLNAIHLMRIGLYPGSDDYAAVFDYSLDDDATDYVLSVQFSEAGKVVGISMDS